MCSAALRVCHTSRATPHARVVYYATCRRATHALSASCHPKEATAIEAMYQITDCIRLTTTEAMYHVRRLTASASKRRGSELHTP